MADEVEVYVTVRWLLLLAAMLTGCGIAAGRNAPVEAPQVPVTAVATVTALPAATPLQLPEATATFPVLDEDAPPPAPETLRWEPVEGVPGLQRLAGLGSGRLVTAEASPDGRWWVAQVISERLEMDARTYLYLFSSDGEGHWIATTEGYAGLAQWLWLPDGRLLWADGTGLTAAAPDGSEPRRYEIEDLPHELHAAGDGTVVVEGDAALWRVDLEDGRTERVEGIDLASGSISGGALQIAPDRSEASYFLGGRLYRIPVAFGRPAEQVAAFEFPGRGGPLLPTSPLAGGPYWLSGELAVVDDGPPLPIFVDTRDGTLIPVAARLGEGEIIQLEASPAGSWVAVSTSASRNDPAETINVLTGGDLAPAHTIAGTGIVGWDGEAGLYLTTAASALVRLDLASGELVTLVDLPQERSDLIQIRGESIYHFVGGDLDLYDLRGHHRLRLTLPGPGTRLYVGPDSFLLAHGEAGAPLWRYRWAEH